MFNLRAVRQSLAPRGIRCERVEPYNDGRCRFAVFPIGKRYLSKFSDDVDTLYIMGLGMA